MTVGELKDETEVLVIGAGPGGYVAAFRAADLGMDVTLVDLEKRPGGECLFRGCIPSKTLLFLAELLHDAQRSGEMGINFGKPQIDLNRMRGWKDQVIDKLTNGLLTLSKRRKVRLLQGRAAFEASDRVRLENSEVNQIRFRHAILATGSCSTPFPNIPFIKGSRIVDSAGALELPDIPRSLLVLGGGYVGLEMGTIYAALGSRVTVAVRGDRLLRGADPDLVDVLLSRLKETFQAIYFNTQVTSFKEREEGVDVKFEGRPDKAEQTFERVLIAVGRKPNTGNVGLEKTRVKLNEQGFVVVDEQRRTTDEKIFAIGDVAGPPLLAHKAFREGKVAAEVIKGMPSAFDVQAIPAVVYTNPQVAWAGLREELARKENRNIKVERYLWKFSSRAGTMGVSDGVTKMIFSPESGRLLGVGICGPNAEGMISEGTLAIELGALAQDLGLTIHPHPTLSEMMMETAELFTGTVTHVLPERRLASD
ncbi:MAG TPA: dihydrolipoyl dehydrogenase [Thermodesulfobacteriota bacterium]|nr:dihydrolipoyl dehydrogenase [Thermodesulfobacteriota bacterium]